jgi:glycosyltransferase involved in cell wall biosynthesis
MEGAPYRVVTVPLEGSLRTFRFALALRSVDYSGFDVLHAHGDDTWLWRRRVPVHVRTMHGSGFSEARRIAGAREKVRMVALGLGELVSTVAADRTYANSPGTRRLMPWVRDVLPPGVDLTRFARPAGAAREDRPTILFVGTLGRRKRGQLLVDAFTEAIRPRLPDAQLWMVTEDKVSAPGVESLGRLSDEELVERYHRAWVFSLPSSFEGFGIPYAEALAAGLPVVATPNQGARYVLDDGRAGVLTEEGSLGSELLRLLLDDGERDRLTQVGLERAKLFDLATVTDRYEDAYYSLAGWRRDQAGPGRAT